MPGSRSVSDLSSPKHRESIEPRQPFDADADDCSISPSRPARSGQDPCKDDTLTCASRKPTSPSPFAWGAQGLYVGASYFETDIRRLFGPFRMQSCSTQYRQEAWDVFLCDRRCAYRVDRNEHTSSARDSNYVSRSTWRSGLWYNHLSHGNGVPAPVWCELPFFAV